MMFISFGEEQKGQRMIFHIFESRLVSPLSCFLECVTFFFGTAKVRILPIDGNIQLDLPDIENIRLYAAVIDMGVRMIEKIRIFWRKEPIIATTFLIGGSGIQFIIYFDIYHAPIAPLIYFIGRPFLRLAGYEFVEELPTAYSCTHFL